MAQFRRQRGDDGTDTVEVAARGRDVLCDALLNKGTAFSAEERRALKLEGMLPPSSSTLKMQVERAYANITRKEDALEQYIGLASLQDRNETLFYRLMADHLETFAPIVYTPTVGLACQAFSHIFRRGRGIWITPEDRGHIERILRDADVPDTRLIVATDNERILGLGDQGAGGMGIPIGKLVLYSVGAGLHPSQVLPISLDVGTDNQQLLEDPLYVGFRQPRLRGEGYDSLVEEFVTAVEACFPNVLLQWEDFKKATAFRLLDRYRDRLLSFNDDIQGTAAVALAGIIAASHATGTPMSEQRIVILGAGAAGIGIARQVRDALHRHGVSGDALVTAIGILDSSGLLVDSRDLRDAYKNEFAWPQALAAVLGLTGSAALSLEPVIDKLKPTVLIGTSGQPGSFDEASVRTMYKHCKRPVIFPFSNPTSQAEAVPKDLIEWTDGQALIASGSPFDPVEHRGRTHRIGQGNNVYIFPGVGLGAITSQATVVTDAMFTVAAEVLADNVDASLLSEGALYPSLSSLREVTLKIALRVAEEAVASKVAPSHDRAALEKRMAALVWDPHYPALRAV